MKNVRQQKILELIEKYDIDTQDTLITKLRELGFNVTQTTVSRDIKQLNIVKSVSSKGTYKYVAPGIRKDEGAPVLSSAITDSVIKISAAGNIVVVKTYTVMANAIAVCVDSLYHESVIGSVAGDDTILLVVADADAASQLAFELREKFS